MANLNPVPDCIDLEQQPAKPLLPNDNSIRLYADGNTGNLAAIRSDGSSALPSGSGTPGGADTQVQFNNAGAFGGDPNLTWNTSTGSFNAQSPSGLSSIGLDGSSENVTLVAENFITFSAVGAAGIFSNTELDLDSIGPIQIGLQPSTQIGFFNTAAISQPTITGAKAGNTALTLSILATLTALGLAKDGTT